MKPTDEIVYDGKKIKLYLYYNWVLDYFDMFARKDMDDYLKIETALSMFIHKPLFLCTLSPKKKVELCELIQSELIAVNKRKSSKGPRVVDYRHDFELISAGFKQTYGIDLYEQRNKMSWKNFYNLFTGLPADTKICEVISIRARELPAPNKYNAKERQSLMEAKQYWALPADGSLPDNYQSELNGMFDTMLKLCGR